MQETNYSLGPKFFGTSTKSIFPAIKSLGSMRVIVALLAPALMTLTVLITQPNPTGLSGRTPRGTPFSISTTDSTHRRIDISLLQ
jgi:hypothetical protein